MRSRIASVMSVVGQGAVVATVICVATASVPVCAGEYVADTESRIESLENGKITFAYDGDGAITNLTMTPDPGETLTLSGDALNFAANARIIPGQNGTSCISNAITCAGTLQIGTLASNLTWTTTEIGLTTTAYTKLFENVNLSEISVVSAVGTSYMAPNANKGDALPYFVRRTGDTEMTVELQQVDTSGYQPLRALLLELKQEGTDIYGRVPKAWYSSSNGDRYVGFCLQDTGLIGTYANICAPDGGTGGFGIKSLTICPRRETFDYIGTFLSDQYDTIVARNVRIEDLEIAYACACYSRSLASFPKGRMSPHHVKFENGVLTAQLYNLNDTMTKCVKIALSQSGNDVVGRAVYAKYADDHLKEYDFDVEGHNWNLATEENFSGYRYGVEMLALRYKSRNRLTLMTPGWREINFPMSGTGVEVTFDAGTTPGGATEANVTRSGTLLCGTDWVTLTTARALRDITVVGGRVCGRGCGNADGIDSVVFDWRNDGENASFQVHGKSGEMVKGVDVEMRQNGNAVEIRCARAVLHRTKWAIYLGRKRVVPGVDGAENYTLGTSTNYLSAYSYALKYVEYDIRPSASIYCTAENRMTDSAFVIKGDATRPMSLHILHKDALPAGSTDVYGDAELYASVDAGNYNNGISSGLSAITMHPGTRLYQRGTYVFMRGAQRIVLDSATIYPQYLDATVTYADYVTMSNASHMAAGELRSGYRATNPAWRVAGEGKSVCDTDLRLLAYASGKGGAEKKVTIDVADTVAGDGIDFTMNGDIYNDGSYMNAAFIKAGIGTMEMNGTITCTNVAPGIVEGTLLLNKTDATIAGVGFDLEGGTLACAAGTANAVAAVNVTADSAIAVGAGASFTMANVTVADGQTLSIECADGTSAKAVKVNATLDGVTLSRIRLNGRRPRQTSDGYLVLGGFMLIVR
ncbi:MAG: hypothetical protein J6Z49_03935 [Kiritimatiellae bacterium]|nr:hypothetical protein [Kiritimatiellia bacterium]